jgi:hypothetical protein
VVKAEKGTNEGVLLIGGDVAPTGCNASAARDGAVELLFDDLLEEFSAADFSIVNLESPLVEAAKSIIKTGPVLSGPPETARTIKRAGIDAVNLGNNHIMDHGEHGLWQTIKACKDAGLVYFGAGRDSAEARVPLSILIQGVRLAVMSVAEHEFSIAGSRSPGANGMDLIDCTRMVESCRKEHQWTVVLVHGGTEMYPYPSPSLQKTCRFLVEVGASSVICQHSHCAGCYEFYRGASIVYGQGNLLFDAAFTEDPEWHRGFLVKLLLRADEAHPQMEIIPVLQSLGGPGARRMDLAASDRFRTELEARCTVLDDPQNVRQKWEEHCRGRRATYLSHVLGHGKLMRRLNRKFRLSERLLSPLAVARLLNVVRCESHREALHTVLEALYREKTESMQ